MTLILYKYNIIVFDKGRLACQIVLLKIKDTILPYKLVNIWDFFFKMSKSKISNSVKDLKSPIENKPNTRAKGCYLKLICLVHFP